MVFFLILGICLVAAAVALNIGWIVLNWREGIFFFFGVFVLFVISNNKQDIQL